MNSDLTDLEIFGVEMEKLEAFEMETRQEQDLSGFESRSKCLPSFFACFSRGRKRKKRALVINSSSYIEM